MSPTSNPPASGLLARLTGIVVRPRSAMRAAASASAGAVAAAWLVVLVVWLAAGAWLLALPVGRQALVDERVRVVEALGGTVDDARYQGWQAAPPWGTYFTSGGRLLLLPLTTLAVATGLFLWTRRQAPGVRYAAALSVTVHASVILALQQVVATPLHIVRESLTSPFNLAALAPLFDEGSWPARLLSPLAHAAAERGGRDGQAAVLERILAERWWRTGLTDTQVVARRLPADWGTEFALHRDSMNPVMTARFMRAGRMPHRSPWVKGLYLAGSATHPGQWVSFCAVSGVLAALRLHEDAR